MRCSSPTVFRYRGRNGRPQSPARFGAAPTARRYPRRVETRSTTWQATVTPLASIIGSGFLVSAPLMVANFGGTAVVAMAILLAFAYALGHVMRFNIARAEPLLEAAQPDRILFATERLGTAALAFAYFVSVAFYLALLGVFVLDGFGIDGPRSAKWLTTSILILIGVMGLIGGLRTVERVEEIAVNFKLAVIAGVCLALLLTDVGDYRLGEATWPAAKALSGASIAQLLGLLIICQGFETSRFLGSEFDAATRIRTMRLAQLIAGAIYLGFVVLATPLLAKSGRGEGVTAIIDVTRTIGPVLAIALTLGAAASQFTAATADSIASTGIVNEVSRHKIQPGHAYLILIPIAILVVWATEVRELIAYASRAFAVYYALQCAVAVRVAALDHRAGGGRWRPAAYTLLGLLALATAIFGAPSSE